MGDTEISMQSKVIMVQKVGRKEMEFEKGRLGPQVVIGALMVGNPHGEG